MKITENMIITALTVLLVTIIVVGSYLTSHNLLDLIYICIFYAFIIRYIYLSIKANKTM